MADQKQAIETLKKVMNSGAYALAIRAAAAEGLGFAGGAEARQALAAVLESGAYALDLRVAAARALGRASQA